MNGLECAAIRVATQEYMREQGLEKAPAFCVYITRRDGEELGVQVLSLVNLAHMLTTLQPPRITLLCGRVERDDLLRSTLQTLASAGVPSVQ